jgi:hypothetical protein
MCHPYVAGDEASRPVITEVLKYLDELRTMTTRDEEIPTPKFALPRVHDILFVIGDGYGIFFESYSTRADQWTKVSCTQIHSNSPFLSNYKCPLNFNLFSDCTQHYITVSAESAIRVDSSERFVPKFKFVAIIVHVCGLQSLVILLKNNVHNLYLQHYYKQTLLLCKSKVMLSRYQYADDKVRRIHT